MSEGEEHAQSYAEQGYGGSDYAFLVSHYPFQGRLVVFPEPYGEKCFFRDAVTLDLVIEHVAAEHRSECKGYERRCEKGRDERHSERCKHSAFHSGEEEKRDEADYYYEGGVQYRHSDFPGRIKYHVQNRTPPVFREGLVRPDMFPDIFHIDYGVVHQRAYGYGETSQTHGVYGHSEPVQSQY